MRGKARMERELFEKFGPAYEIEGAGLKQFRARGVICREYGEAVLAAVRATQRRELKGAEGPAPKAPRPILEEIAAAHRAALAAAPAQERKARKPAVWAAMYEAAMAEKRRREAAPIGRAA